MAKSPNHVHKLRRHKYKTGHAVFFCTLPDCHYKVDSELVFGKTSLCNYCNGEFTMNERSLRLIKPHCDGCGRVKVRDSEGKLRFVKKLANKQLPPIAKDTSQDLRSRLDSVVATELEDDI